MSDIVPLPISVFHCFILQVLTEAHDSLKQLNDDLLMQISTDPNFDLPVWNSIYSQHGFLVIFQRLEPKNDYGLQNNANMTLEVCMTSSKRKVKSGLTSTVGPLYAYALHTRNLLVLPPLAWQKTFLRDRIRTVLLTRQVISPTPSGQGGAHFLPSACT